MSTWSSGATGLATFEIENDVTTVDSVESLLQYDAEHHQALLQSKPWKKSPHYFREVRLSLLALIKMVSHAKSGGDLEIMGMMQGKIDGHTFVIYDAFILPVHGTETRVNVQDEGYEYMSEYLDSHQDLGRKDNVVGWYHSHPGYGCWLSGIDVATQRSQQMYSDPFVAIVIDPHRTAATGKVDIGAFRCFPENVKAAKRDGSSIRSVPVHKVEDFGIHAEDYYPLTVSVFKTKSDSKLLQQFWAKYWVGTLASNPLMRNRTHFNEQMKSITGKLEPFDSEMYARTRTTSIISTMTGNTIGSTLHAAGTKGGSSSQARETSGSEIIDTELLSSLSPSALSTLHDLDTHSGPAALKHLSHAVFETPSNNFSTSGSMGDTTGPVGNNATPNTSGASTSSGSGSTATTASGRQLAGAINTSGGGGAGGVAEGFARVPSVSQTTEAVGQVCQDANTLSTELVQGLLSQTVKEMVFLHRCNNNDSKSEGHTRKIPFEMLE